MLANTSVYTQQDVDGFGSGADFHRSCVVKWLNSIEVFLTKQVLDTGLKWFEYVLKKKNILRAYTCIDHLI